MTGLARQLSGVHRSDITLTPEQKPLLICCSEGPGYTQAADRPPVAFALGQALAAKAEFAFARLDTTARGKTRWLRLRWTTSSSMTSPFRPSIDIRWGQLCFCPAAPS